MDFLELPNDASIRPLIGIEASFHPTLAAAEEKTGRFSRDDNCSSATLDRSI
jgi:hypothetical protein